MAKAHLPAPVFIPVMCMRLVLRCMFMFGLIAVLACLCAFGPESSAWGALRRADQSLKGGAPEFPWASFQRFWNVRCLPGCEIQDPQLVGGNYIVRYGYSVSLVVRMELNFVRSVTAIFTDPKGSQGGGQLWLKLVDSIIRVGVFRWPESRIEQVRERFMDISKIPVSYKWQTSSFRRSYDPATGWEFTLDMLRHTVTDGD